MKKRNKDIADKKNTPKEQFRASVKAYARWFGVGSLVGVGLGIWLNISGVSTVFVFACLFGAIGYQLKMKSYDRRK